MGSLGFVLPAEWFGILAGVVVFTVTIATVLCLVVKGGTLQRLKLEAVPTLSRRPPLLHDHLLAAACTLPARPAPFCVTGRFVRLRALDAEQDAPRLLAAAAIASASAGGNGDSGSDMDGGGSGALSPFWSVRDYGPYQVGSEHSFVQALRRGLPGADQATGSGTGVGVGTSSAGAAGGMVRPSAGTALLLAIEALPTQGEHGASADTCACAGVGAAAGADEDGGEAGAEGGGEVMGLVVLSDHVPHCLRLRVRDLWCEPAAGWAGVPPEARPPPKALEAELVSLLLGALFERQYRRVEWCTDACDARSRALASKNGFSLEGVLRKHGIVRGRNRDSALYSVLNSEWQLLRGQLQARARGGAPRTSGKVKRG
eukprot:g7939.t1